MDFSIVPRDAYLEVSFSGRPTPEDYNKYFDALFEHDAWKSGMSVLTDNTDLDARDVTAQEVRDIADVCTQRSSELGAARTAILVENDLEYGMVRMWSVFVEGEWDVELAIFRTRNEAIEWLLK